MTEAATTGWTGLAALVVLAGAFYLVPVPVLYGPLFVCLALLAWPQPENALALVVLFTPFFMAPKHLGHEQFGPSELFLMLDVAIVGGHALLPNRAQYVDLAALSRSPFLWPALLLLLAGVLSALVAADRHLALAAFRLRILEPVVFFALLLVVARRQRWLACFACLLGAGFVVGCVAIFQLVTHTGLTIDAGALFPKVNSVYGSPDNVGLLYDRVVPVWIVALILAARKPRLLALLGTVGAVLLVTLFFTFSRGAWIALVIVFLAMVALYLRRVRHPGVTSKGRGDLRSPAVLPNSDGRAQVARTTSEPKENKTPGRVQHLVPQVTVTRSKAAALVVGVVIVVAALAGIGGPRVIHALDSGHAGTAATRLYIWQSAWRMGSRHPLLGIGEDNFLYYWAPSSKQDPYSKCGLSGLGYFDTRAASEPCLSHPHNEFLDFWLSTGILGLAAFLWIETVFWRSWLRGWRPGASTSIVTLGAGGAMAASLFHGLVDNSYFLPDLAVLFWLLCAYLSWQTTAGDFALRAEAE